MRSRSKGKLLTCFNCNDSGHMSWQCRKPINKCTNCNFLGHNSNNCPKKNSSNSNNYNNQINPVQNKSNKNVLEVLIDDDENDKYKIAIKINGILIPCQVDLGSQATLIREVDACKLKLVWELVRGPMLKGLGNVPYLPIGKALVDIEVQNVKEDQVEVFIVDNSLINVPVLLGHSFTERPGLRIVKTASDLFFERVELDQIVKLILVAVDDINIDKGKLQAMEVSSEDNYNGYMYVNGSIRGKPGMEYYLLPGEYHMCNGMSRVLV